MGSRPPATIVLCATLPTGFRKAACRSVARISAAVPVAWIADAALAGELALQLTAAGRPCDVVVDLRSSAAECRSGLRQTLRSLRDDVPGLSTVRFRAGSAAAQRQILVEEGIRISLVDDVGADARGSRRPAPRGWKCRNVSWGLWEIGMETGRRRGIRRWLSLGGMRVPAAGGLMVVRLDGVTLGNGGDASISSRLERAIAWVQRLESRGVATGAALTDVSGLLAAHGRPALAGSVLRAA